ncbi:hypothetical protein EU805_06240 [Salipiger sp. IMCC34102]|uniref:tryptophan-rich sensory protein n=1 Tax=Salipiger sp. IMCC34102 TaxID=2510647 RepID=UPI00101C6A1E|nr:tryptophan-rich sensory protein [Salipiger sp. IMCC34102]RYH03319.1 hypothetical protein EU805_06240 [Salipiger sp. IMCC34102]
MRRLIAPLTLAVTLAFAVAPLFTSFSGFDATQLPVPQIDPPVQPAGYTFGIWGLIYLWLIVSAVYGVLRKRDDPAWNRARTPLCASLALGVPWLWIATESALLATLLIWLMLGFAILALLRASREKRLFLRAPVALYAGWLTAASFVSLATVLAGYGIGMTSYGWAFAGILGTLGMGIVVYRILPAPLYLAALVWALVGIIAANGLETFMVTATALSGVVVLACVMAVYFPRDMRP